MRLIGRVDAVQHALERALHDGERRAQLVADVGQERSSRLLVRGQPRAHRIERASQRPNLRRAAFRHLGADLPRLDPPGALDEVRDRRAGPPDQPETISTIRTNATNGSDGRDQQPERSAVEQAADEPRDERDEAADEQDEEQEARSRSAT